jgi:hypothetical protein
LEKLRAAPQFGGDAFKGMQFLVKGAPPERRGDFAGELLAAGCKDAQTTEAFARRLLGGAPEQAAARGQAQAPEKTVGGYYGGRR